jgi:hypothetical protein
MSATILAKYSNGTSKRQSKYRQPDENGDFHALLRGE